jgi:PTH1 family peptidyl-tRNA hydrolase
LRVRESSPSRAGAQAHAALSWGAKHCAEASRPAVRGIRVVTAERFDGRRNPDRRAWESGPRAATTRHNVGFHTADRLAGALDLAFSRQRFEAFVASGTRRERKLILAKPQTFMNLSGGSVAALVRFFHVPLERLLVCADDIDLPLGTLRLRPFGGSGGHRGLRSIISALGSQTPSSAYRVSRPPGAMQAADYVLQAFDRQEQVEIEASIARAAEAALMFLDDGIESAMNRFNGDSGSVN